MNKKQTFALSIEERRAKLEEIILYVADRLEHDLNFGRTKLAKVLYHADFLSYRLYQEPITGWDYVKWQFGPVPNDYLAILNSMEEERRIATKETSVINHVQKRIIALHPANLKLITGRDLQLIERVIGELEGKTAGNLSHESHGVAYNLVELNKVIPYESSLFSDEELTDEEVKVAERLARELDLD
jgi:hypothetical protein